MSFESFILGFLSSLTATLFCILVVKLRPIFSNLEKYELTGLYVADFDPIFPEGSRTIEILFITNKSEIVDIKLENYNSAKKEVAYAKGTGKFRLNSFVSIYYSISSGIPSIGSFLLKNEISRKGNRSLSGFYFQHIEAAKDTLPDELSKIPYKLYRVDEPNWKLVWRRYFLKKQFHDYEDAKEWFDELNYG